MPERKCPFVYDKGDGERLISLLKEAGIDAEIIGTLPSDHDIDVLIKSTPKEVEYLHQKIFRHVLSSCYTFETDIGSFFVRSCEFGGHVDVFFSDPRKWKDYETYQKEKNQHV